MKFFYLNIIVLLALFSACKSKEKTVETSYPPPPGWVTSRPISSMHYVGIGVAQKAPASNFQKAARDNALSDLASEIKVNVNTNSLLYTLERDYKIEQEFKETIRISSNLNLEDYEAMDSWEDATSYWVYYRLNKEGYAEQQREKQVGAQELAKDFLAKAQSAEGSAQFYTAADLYLKGLQALEMYWGENNQVDYQGRTILLDNELFEGARSLISDSRITIENDLELNYQNRFRSSAEVRITSYKNEMPLEGVPIVYEYFGNYGRFKGKASTNADGRCLIPIDEADRERVSNSIIVSIDTDQLFQPFQNDQFMKKLTSSLRGASVQKPIVHKAPTVYMISEEKNLGKATDGVISAAIMTSLGRRGVQFATNEQSADLLMRIEANTRSGNISQGFATSLLTLNIGVVDNKTKQNVYKVSRSDLKGVDLDYERAGMKAYQNYTRNIESELMRKLTSDLF